MPDLLTHMTVGWVGGMACRLRKTRIAFFIFGNLLPDLCSRPFYILFRDKWIYKGVYSLHSPFSQAAIVMFLSCFINPKFRKDFRICVFAGCLTHQLFDIFQRGLGGYTLLFPFSSKLYLYPFYTVQQWYGVTVAIMLILVSKYSWVKYSERVLGRRKVSE